MGAVGTSSVHICWIFLKIASRGGLVGSFLLIHKHRIPRRIGKIDAVALGAGGAGKGGRVVVRVDVIRVPAQQIDGHQLIFPIILVSGPFRRFNSDIHDSGGLKLRFEHRRHVHFGIAVMAGGVPEVKFQLIVFIKTGLCQHCFGFFDVAVSKHLFEIIGMGPHAHGHHGVKRLILTEKHLFDDIRSIDGGGHALADDFVGEGLGVVLKTQIADVRSLALDGFNTAPSFVSH